MKILTALTLSIILSGCAAQNVQKQTMGEFSSPLTQNIGFMVNDSAKKIGDLFSPASTQIKLNHKFEGVFGAALINNLRKQGFSIFAPNLTLVDDVEDEVVPSQVGVVELGFILDQPAKGLFRVSIFADDQSLTRAYAQVDNKFIPAGAWVFKE